MICAESVERKWELSYIVYVIVHYSAHSGSELRRFWVDGLFQSLLICVYLKTDLKNQTYHIKMCLFSYYGEYV